MKRNIKRKIFFTLASLCCFACCAQRFDSALSKIDREYKQEKLYLHFDRSVYSPGETIWFKAYLFTGNYPSPVSKTMYAELVDDKGKVIDHKTAPVLSSSAASSFDLPQSLAGPIVYIRAYTKWMLNFDSSFIFSKAIAIAAPYKFPGKVSPSTPLKTTSVTTSPVYYLQFFPEGGDLAEGVESRVAFKATDRFGMPINVNGKIVDKSGKAIISFASVHDGMGAFLLQPLNGEQYKALWKDNAGQLHESLLPAAKPNGFALEANSSAIQIEYKIKRSSTNPAPYPFVYIVAQMNNQLLYRAKVNTFKNAAVSSIIQTENFPAGIVQLTLFTPDEKQIAERLVFVNQFGYTFITDLNAALKDMGKKKKNVLQIDVPDTLACNLSVSVTDADLNPQQEKDNIISHLFLTADIKGYVNDPAYYFSGDADSLADHLDLVMMTNGWRRFNWDNILANRWPVLSFTPEGYLAIEGQAHGLNRTLLANKDLDGILELKDKKREFMTTPVDPSGKFIFSDMIFYDTAKLYYQFNNDKKRDLTSRATFDIRDNLFKNILRLKPDSFLQSALSKPDTAALAKNIEIYKERLNAEELQKVKTLKTVVVTAKQKTKKESVDEEYTSGLFSGGESRIFLPEGDPAFIASQNVLQYLQGRVAGLQISGTPSSISWRGSATSLFLNEMQSDVSLIENISMSDVAMVKVFSPPFFGAFGGGAGGAIAVYTKKGASANTGKGLDFVPITGYSPVKEFYSPDYSKTNFDSSDYRKTIYWNPFVVTDKSHRRILLPFYNNDITKKIKVIIEGCNEEGKLTRVEKVLQ